MKNLNVLLLALIASLTMFSCSSDDDENAIVGIWKHTSIKINVDCNDANFKDWAESEGGLGESVVGWVEFLNDGTFKDSDGDFGHYTAKDGKLTTVYESFDDPDTDIVSYSIDGNTMTIEYDRTNVYKEEYEGWEGWEDLIINKFTIYETLTRQ